MSTVVLGPAACVFGGGGRPAPSPTPVIAPAQLDSLAAVLSGEWRVWLVVIQPSGADSSRVGRGATGSVSIIARAPSSDAQPPRDYVWIRGATELDPSSVIGHELPYAGVSGRGRLVDQSVALELGSCQYLDSPSGMVSCVDHGWLKLNGELRGDSIVGQWEQITGVGGAGGTFVMRRAAASEASR